MTVESRLLAQAEKASVIDGMVTVSEWGRVCDPDTIIKLCRVVEAARAIVNGGGNFMGRAAGNILRVEDSLRALDGEQ